MRWSSFASAALAVAASLLVTVSAPRDARACGGCFHGPPTPTETGDPITDHRMIFSVSPQQTTLYDEIEYTGNPASFAWVLPIHAPVTVGLSADVLFASLDATTATIIQGPPYPVCPSSRFGASGAGGGATPPSADSPGGVTVVAQQVVGPYDTVQLQSTDPNALTAWLGANGYVIPPDVAPIIAAYVSEGFDFLALRLQPGQGVQAMRPVSVTSPGAGLSLPLRMVAAGTGATVGITLWVVAQGRYEPQNFPSFTIDPSQLVWDFSAGSSNFTSLRQQQEAAAGFATWQVESSIDVSPYIVEDLVMQDTADQDYLPGASGQTADDVRMQDLATIFPGNQDSVRVTRLRADLAHAALATDLALQAAADQSALSNVYVVTTGINGPACGNGGGGDGLTAFACTAAPRGGDLGVDAALFALAALVLVRRAFVARA